MTLGGVTLPSGTQITKTIKDIEVKKRTRDGTLKRDITGQKRYYTLKVPTISGTTFDNIKALKEAQSNVSFVYPDESGSGNITVTVAIGDMKYIRLKEYGSTMWISGLSIPIEEA